MSVDARQFPPVQSSPPLPHPPADVVGGLSSEDFKPEFTQQPLTSEWNEAIATSELMDLSYCNSPEYQALAQSVRQKLEKLAETSSEFAPQQLSRLPLQAIKLTHEQQHVLNLIVIDGQSIFFTGAAGTGKSILLRRVIEELRSRHGKESVAVCASTGIAAVAIGGRTVHAWSGIGQGKGEWEKLLKSVYAKRACVENWRRTRVLIIDEISMISPDLLDSLDKIGQRLRKNPLPFGGIQLVFTGDFFQLPPVTRYGEEESRKYAFDSQLWKNGIKRTICLTQVFRQKDTLFQNILNEMRHGRISNESAAIIQKLSRPPKVPENITPTRLYARRNEVDRANNLALDVIKGDEQIFTATDTFYDNFPNDPDARPLSDLQRQNLTWIAQDKVRLKTGAQVMMIKNIDSTLVNGSVGTVVKWIHTPPIMEGGKRVVCISDIIDTLELRDMSELSKLNRQLDAPQTPGDKKVPIVRFYNRDGTFREVIVTPEQWDYEDEKGNLLARRTQIPLILAYALSIHKSQGQTLDYVHVDMRSIFEVGQAYVAISRATTLEGLQVTSFQLSKIKSCPRVTGFYERMEQVSKVVQPTVTDFFGGKRERAAEEVESEEKERSGWLDYLQLFKHQKVPTVDYDSDFDDDAVNFDQPKRSRFGKPSSKGD